jgi:AcrR family transcriptional regulator
MATEQPDRQERRKRRTRQAIQTAALELFAERGYRQTTISDIAERADVAPRTVTVHFPAKEELLFDAEPFTLDSLSTRLATREPGEPALQDQRARAGRTLLGTARPPRAHHQHRARASRPRPRQLLPLRARPRGGHQQRPRPARQQPDPAPCGIVSRRRLARALRERRSPGPGSPPERRRTAQARGHGNPLHAGRHRRSPVTAAAAAVTRRRPAQRVAERSVAAQRRVPGLRLKTHTVPYSCP